MSKIQTFQIPEYEYRKYDNLEVAALHNNLQALVSASVHWPIGSFEEDIPGLANITMQLLISGSDKYSAKKISELSDEKGIRFSAGANRDDSKVSTYCLTEHFDRARDLLTESVLNPKFDEIELERIKKKTLAEIELKLSEPGYLSRVEFLKTFFTGTGYGNPRAGTKESVASIRVADCRMHYEKMAGRRPLLVLAGDYETQALDELSAAFRKDNFKPNYSEYAFISPELEQSVVIADKADAPQASITAGLPAMNRLDPDYPVLQVVNTIFGGYFNSRLNHILREDKGYTYGIHSLIDGRKYTSLMQIISDTDNKHVEKMLPVIFDEAARLADEPVDADELETAKNYILGAFLRNTETPFQVAGLIRNIHINGYSEKYFEKYMQTIKDAAPSDVRRVAARHFSGKNYTVAIAGDKKILEDVRI